MKTAVFPDPPETFVEIPAAMDPAVQRVADEDREFFRARAGRHCRLRPARGEHLFTLTPPRNMRAYTIVLNVPEGEHPEVMSLYPLWVEAGAPLPDGRDFRAVVSLALTVYRTRASRAVWEQLPVAAGVHAPHRRNETPYSLPNARRREGAEPYLVLMPNALERSLMDDEAFFRARPHRRIRLRPWAGPWPPELAGLRSQIVLYGAAVAPDENGGATVFPVPVENHREKELLDALSKMSEPQQEAEIIAVVRDLHGSVFQ